MSQEADELRKERDELRKEREELKKEREELKKEREELKKERDEIKKLREGNIGQKYEVAKMETVPAQPVQPVDKDIRESQTLKITKSKSQIAARIVPPTLGPILPVAIIKDLSHAQQQGNKIIHSDDNNNHTTVTFNPIISSGVVRFEGVFQSQGMFVIIGIADSTAVFGPNKWPSSDGNKEKTVRYDNGGNLSHIGSGTKENAPFDNGRFVGCEVDMNSTPKTLTFFVDGKQQPVQVINIPNSIRFWIFVNQPGQSFGITRYERILSTQAKGKGKQLEWGKEWKFE